MALPVKRFHFNFLKDLLGEKEEDNVFRPKTHFGNPSAIFKGRGKRVKFSSGGSYYSFGGGGYKSDYDYSQSRQFCTFISSHRYDKALNKKHSDYIQKEGKGLNGADPELYGTEPEKYEKRMSKKSFRWIISSDNPHVDLNLLVSELIRRVEINTRYRLNWVAANHYNTGIPHAHVLINGFDLDRRGVKFDRDFIKHVIRDTARDICTEMVGVRTTEEREASYQKQTTGNYYTSLDKTLDKVLSGADRITLTGLMKEYNATLLQKRLFYLRDIGLVKYDKDVNLFIFKNNWKEQLKIYAKYNTFLQGLYFTKAHQSRYSLHDIDKLGPVAGKVVKKYYMQENSYNHAVIIETKPGHFLYVPLFEAPSQINVGKTIKIEFQRVATSTGGSRKTMNVTNVGGNRKNFRKERGL